MTWDYAETNPLAGAGGDIYRAFDLSSSQILIPNRTISLGVQFAGAADNRARLNYISPPGGIARKQWRTHLFVAMQVFAVHPFSYEMAILMPHHDFGAAPGKTVPFRKSDCAADCLGLTRIGLGISPSAPDDLPPGLFADDHVS